MGVCSPALSMLRLECLPAVQCCVDRSWFTVLLGVRVRKVLGMLQLEGLRCCLLLCTDPLGARTYGFFFLTQALYRWQKICLKSDVALSFVFDNYCPTMV